MIISCILAGQWIRFRCKKRIDSLEKTKLLIHFTETQLKFSREPVLDLLKNAEKSSGWKSFRFINECINLCKQKNSFSDSWEKSVSLFPPDGFTNDDISILTDFGSHLGTTDLDGQLKICRLYETLFDGQINTAQSNLKQKGSLYSGLGAACGLFIAVVAL